MGKHKNLSAKDHKKIGDLLKRGVPFKQALRRVEREPRSTPARKRSGHVFSGNSGVQSNLRNILSLLEVVSGLTELIGVLTIYGTYGFSFLATILVFAYLLFWEIIGAALDSVGRRIPRPLRVIWRIIEEIVSIIAPGP